MKLEQEDKKCHISKEIGSYFSIDSKDIDKSKNVECCYGKSIDNITFLSTGRSAIDTVIKNIKVKNKKVLLPAFTCHAVIDPFIKNGYEVFPYPIMKDLSINLESFMLCVEELDIEVILIHDYFGYDTNKMFREQKIYEKLKSKNIALIVDMTQSMFSTYEQLSADFYVGSIRKWMGIPDGAFVTNVCLRDEIQKDNELESKKLKAMLYKHEYLQNNEGDKLTLLSYYHEAESVLDSRKDTYSISEVSWKLLGLYNTDVFNHIRRRNGRYLLERLQKIEQLEIPFKFIDEYEVPFYIPIFVKEDRSKLQKYLAKYNVYATIIWSCPEEFDEKIDIVGRSIYSEILCIPCDQRYCEKDMQYICDLVEEFFENMREGN